MCTQVRLFLPQDKIKYINKKGCQITVQFPDREVKISKKEYDEAQNYINNNSILRRNFGLADTVKKEIVNNYSNLQLIPVITMPMMNIQELIQSKGFILINKNINKDNSGGSNENLLVDNENNGLIQAEKNSENENPVMQIPPQNFKKFLNSYIVMNGDVTYCNNRQ